MVEAASFRRMAFIFLFSVATHLYGLTSPILDHQSWTQALRASTARNYYEGGMRFFAPEVDYFEARPHNTTPQFPLYSYLVAILYKAFGPHETLGRALSIFFAALSAVSLYLLSGLFVERRAAFLSALVFCVIPLRIYFMRAVMPESMALLFLIFGTYCAALWAWRESFWPWGLGASLALTLAALLKLPYLIMVIPAFFLLYRKWGIRFLIKGDFLLFCAIFASFYLGWYVKANRGVSESGSFLVWVFASEIQLFNAWLNPRFWTTQFVSRFPELLTTYAGFLFGAIGLALSRKRKDVFLLIWFGCALAYLLLIGDYGLIHQYAALPVAPVNAVLIALGIVWLWDRWTQSAPLRGLVVALALSMPLHAALRIRHWYDLQDLWLLRAKTAVAQMSAPGDLFYAHAFDQPLLLYHIHRKGFAGPATPEDQEYFDLSLEKGARYMLSPLPNWEAMDPEFQSRFKVLHRDPEFVICDLKAGHG